MIFPRGLVISAGGGDFVFEISQGNKFSLELDMCSPAFIHLNPVNAAIFRGAADFVLYFIAIILATSCDAEVGPSIIKAEEISMVNDKTFGKTHNLSVHRNNFSPFGTFIIHTNGIKGFAIFLGEPIEGIQPVEIARVNKGVFALGKMDFAERRAKFTFAIEKHRPGKNTVKPIRNTDC